MSARRKRWIALGLVGVVLLSSAATVTTVLTAASADKVPGGDDAISTGLHIVEREDLVDTMTVPGVLDFAKQHPLAGGLGGTLTAVPAIGDLIDRGGTLYRVDDSPVLLMIGSLPAWRGFDVSMTKGPDVAQLEENLRALGFFAQDPDQRFDWVTREAVRDWQESLGMPRTGQIEVGRVIFEPEARRVGAVTAALGDQIGQGAGVLTLTSQARTVTVELPIADQRVGVAGSPVTVRIPGGTNTPGTISSLGSPKEVPGDGEPKLVIPAEIVLDDPTAAGDVQRITVTVEFQRAVFKDVLAVPVTALIALPGGGLGVEKKTGDGVVEVPVETGSFVRGYVEIIGGDLDESDRVVVPQ
jgi:peptidoglycan hydrolase-like protein with peptidoglycan-binding domain